MSFSCLVIKVQICILGSLSVFQQLTTHVLIVANAASLNFGWPRIGSLMIFSSLALNITGSYAPYSLAKSLNHTLFNQMLPILGLILIFCFF